MIFKEKLSSFGRLIRERSLAVCCGLAPAALLIVFLCTFKFGCSVIVDGKIIGTAKSSEYVYNLINSINQDFSPYFNGSDAITVKPVTTPKLVFKGRFTPENELADLLKSTCPYLKKAYSIKSNSSTIAAFITEKERDRAFRGFISQYADYSDKSSYEILDEITFAYEQVPYGMIKSGESGVKLLSSTYKVNETVKIDADTDANDILKMYNITEEELLELNPDYIQGVTKSVKIVSEVPRIRVMTVQSVTEKQVLRYHTVSVSDDTVYEGETNVKKAGSDGVKITDKQLCMLNGRCISEIITNESTTDAVDEVLVVGTKKYAKGDATGSFERPYSGSLSSRFGTRGGRNHNGIDICGNIGDDITASDGGEVIYADWEDGFGYVVKIDHKNGYITYYAHCNEIYVTAGQQVAKGEVIAALGNTGRSTGPHLHFEVRNSKTGQVLDPLDFLNIK